MKTITNHTASLSRYALLASLAMLVSACSKDDFSPDLSETPAWQPTIAIPLVYTELGISDLAGVNDSSTTLAVDSNLFCTLIYQGRVFELTGTGLVTIPDQGLQQPFHLNNSEILTLANNGQVQVSQSSDLVFALSQGVEVDSMYMDSGVLDLDFQSDFTTNSEVRVTIPGLTKNGIVYSTLVPLYYNGSVPVISQLSVPLDAYRMDLTKGGTTTNTLQVNLTVTVTGNAGGITPTHSITCSSMIRNVQYQTVFGYVGQQTIGNIQDTVALSIFNHAQGIGSFTLADPRVRFDIGNSLGIPFHARLAQLTALQSNMTSFTVATGVPDPLPVQSPSFSQIGQTLTTSFELNNGNSNIVTMMNGQPKYLIAQSTVTANPAGQTPNHITRESRLTMDMYAELPLHGTAAYFTIRDTVPFSYNDLDQVEHLTLRLNVENWFPMEAGMQLVFTDDNFLALDSVFLPGEVIIPSGVIPANSERVTLPGTKILDYVFDRNRIQKILNARNIMVESTAATAQQPNTDVKIFNDYKLKLKIGAIAKLKIE